MTAAAGAPRPGWLDSEAWVDVNRATLAAAGLLRRDPDALTRRWQAMVPEALP